MAEMSTYRLTLTDQSTSTEDYDVDYNGSTITAKTCKGLLYALNLTNNNYTIKLHPTTSTTIGGEEVYGFFFQEDNDLKTGLNGAIAFNSTNTVEPDNEIGYTPDQIIIQGLQITGTSFLQISTINQTTNTSFQNIYFKDCVYTMSDGTAGCFSFKHGSSGKLTNKIKNCKFSIHIRQGDLSNQIIFGGNWDSCSFYIEFSDLTDGTISSGMLFPSNLNLCSIIVRGASMNGCTSDGGSSIYDFNLIEACSNSSFDFQFKKIDTSSYNGIWISSINNCFISIKSNEWGTGGRGVFVFRDTISGVNIINTGNNGETYTPTIGQNSGGYGAVKGLSETDCKNARVLSSWGFFVNTQI